MTMEQSRWNGKQDSTEVQTSEQGHAHLVCVRNDDILAGDGLAAGLASMFRLRNGLRGSQSRMA